MTACTPGPPTQACSLRPCWLALRVSDGAPDAVPCCAVLCCSFYGDPIPGHILAERVASYVHVFNLYWYVR